jgi:hypothetical protein
LVSKETKIKFDQLYINFFVGGLLR